MDIGSYCQFLFISSFDRLLIVSHDFINFSHEPRDDGAGLQMESLTNDLNQIKKTNLIPFTKRAWSVDGICTPHVSRYMFYGLLYIPVTTVDGSEIPKNHLGL